MNAREWAGETCTWPNIHLEDLLNGRNPVVGVPAMQQVQRADLVRICLQLAADRTDEGRESLILQMSHRTNQGHTIGGLQQMVPWLPAVPTTSIWWWPVM